MTRSMMLATLVLLTGCERDPLWFGYWELASVERDGVRQDDAGLLEIDDRSEVAMLLRYRWTGEAFEPDPRPDVIFGTSDARKQDDIVESYKSKGETYTLTLSFFGTLDVRSWRGDRAVLHGRGATWPGSPPDELGEVVLRLER